ncbi:MAG: hypothetical protein CMM15_01690 [Rhodospirillaceae bacterium]|nr:hypothetical protein [Rhodospirillaceae bacterium]|tara:strand:+ start:6007 stop:6657 length:651 start_codon:yes stop_codon:yes gene_type:complete
MDILSEQEISIFHHIVNFIGAINEIHGEFYENIALYNILLEKTGLVHKDPVRKHISLFSDFLLENQKAILEKDSSAIMNSRMEYSSKVYLDFQELLEITDDENREVIWQHLLALLAIVDPLSKARDIIAADGEEGDKMTESNFISNIVQKVTENIDENKMKDPAEMVNSILGSGIFTDLVQDMNQGITSGELDLSKMMGGLQSIMGDLSKTLDKKI